LFLGTNAASGYKTPLLVNSIEALVKSAQSRSLGFGTNFLGDENKENGNCKLSGSSKNSNAFLKSLEDAFKSLEK
jgi:hypothetical protein